MVEGFVSVSSWGLLLCLDVSCPSRLCPLIKTKLWTVYNVTVAEILEKGYFLYFVPLLFQFYFINVLNLILLYHVFLFIFFYIFTYVHFQFHPFFPFIFFSSYPTIYYIILHSSCWIFWLTIISSFSEDTPGLPGVTANSILVRTAVVVL